MIHNVRNAGRCIKVRPSERLRVYFVSLARRVVSWKQAAGYSQSTGVSIGVTGVEDKSGRSVVAFNLAASLASLGHGNVLFVETEYSSSGFSRKVPRPGFGLSELLAGSQSPSACICNTTEENLFVVSSGRVRGKGAMKLPVEALESITPELCNSFSYIIFDLPVANEMTLCFPILDHLDGGIIVNTPNIHENQVQRVVKRIRDLNKPVIGLVLNKT